MATSSDRGKAIRAISEGRVQVEGEGLPFAFYPPGWLSRSALLTGPKRMTLKYLLVVIQSEESLSYEAARQRVTAMVRDGTLRKVEDEDGTEVYEVVPTSEKGA